MNGRGHPWDRLSLTIPALRVGLFDYGIPILNAKQLQADGQYKKEIQVHRIDFREIQVERRDFIKTATLASVAMALPGTGLASQNSAAFTTPQPDGAKKNVLCLTENPKAYEGFIERLNSLPGASLHAYSVQVSYQRPDEIIRTIHEKEADILLMILSRFTFSFGSLYDSMADSDIPVIVLSTNSQLIHIDINLVASLRGNGANVTFAQSQEQALRLVKLLASPGILQDQRAVIYGKPFDSTSVPAHKLTEDRVYQRTGVRMQYQPIDELASLMKTVDEGIARKEMERWRKEAAAVIRVPDHDFLEVCKLYCLLRSIIEKEGLGAVSIDCLAFTMSPNPVLPHPCLAFARLRDEGITAACEADVCGMLSSLFLEKVTRKPSFMCNLMSADVHNSVIVLSHCVAPLRLNGPNAAPMKYKLHDYHNLKRGVVPEVEFPLHKEVITGGFSKDLKSFSLWPGRIQTQALETDQASSGIGFMRNVCANTIDVKVTDAERYLQNVPGIHQVMILGGYIPAIRDALYAMTMNLVGPADFTPPTA